MKASRIVVIVIAILVIAIIGIFAYTAMTESTSTTTSSTTWIAGPGYPIEIGGVYGVAAQPCVIISSNLYCVGGQDADGNPYSNVYSSGISSGMDNWTSQTSYPFNVMAQPCVSLASSLYCIAGMTDASGDDGSANYFSQVSQSGSVGNWNSTIAYPIAIDSQYCAVSSGFIYCIGGNNETDGTNGASIESNSVWYASISSSGIGSWSDTTAYPGNIYFPSCVASSGYIYCVGGVDGNSNTVNSVYYASLSSTGVEAWTKTTNYPTSLVGQACAISSNTIYCVAGQSGQNSYSNAVYYATISSSGVGTWQKAPSYPVSVETTCAASSTDLYCIGGFVSASQGVTSSVYYAPLPSL